MVTKEQVVAEFKRRLAIIDTIVEIVKESREGRPEGEMYALLMPAGIDLRTFNYCVEIAVEAGKLTKTGHLLKAA